MGFLRETQPSESGQRPRDGGRGRHSAGQEVKSDSNASRTTELLFTAKKDQRRLSKDQKPQEAFHSFLLDVIRLYMNVNVAFRLSNACVEATGGSNAV